MIRYLTRRDSLFALTAAGVFAVAAGRARAADLDSPVGVLVMAHGGGAKWNGEVEEMLAPVGRDYPLEIAFGMADAASLQDAVSRLEARGLRRIAVVRLFISGESWLERTRQILGLRPGAPPRPVAPTHRGHDPHQGHGMDLWRLDTTATFALSTEGLADAPEMGAVLVERARALSNAPRRESVLILGHGPGDDGENQRWLARIDARAEAVRAALPFRRVKVETLREDWPEKRAAAEGRIRAFVEEANQDGGSAIIIPYRVAGFGPYASVMEGLSYISDGKGLIPSSGVEQWVRRQIEELRNGPFNAPGGG